MAPTPQRMSFIVIGPSPESINQQLKDTLTNYIGDLEAELPEALFIKLNIVRESPYTIHLEGVCIFRTAPTIFDSDLNEFKSSVFLINTVYANGLVKSCRVAKQKIPYEETITLVGTYEECRAKQKSIVVGRRKSQILENTLEEVKEFLGTWELRLRVIAAPRKPRISTKGV